MRRKLSAIRMPRVARSLTILGSLVELQGKPDKAEAMFGKVSPSG